MSKTKIVVIHLKEIIYTALFAGLGILLIILLVIMFLNKKEDTTATMSGTQYTPGVYNSTLVLNDAALNLEVVLDKDHINSVRIVNIDDSITTMFPLVEPSLNDISEQLVDGVDINSIEVSEDSKYTQTLLLDAIKAALAKASPDLKDK
ncbi:hypothetical protein Ana3638_01700 [Anaerocolumna sedimenticola]|uniref:FMN-binding domain-containing protein n=1 Tax=Anaerocolumna sedimenticola TaxID=2696063 RepID=A0A6P1TK68_9FIRM|nr:hypothetical protein [Anaerocolumna sedimenticola]QHQ59668.1 hypothetical protein Ana3638_01700 [Anaerocolumna sedimenticola]